MLFRKSKIQDESNFKFYWDSALGYQKLNGYPIWPEYPDEMIKREIDRGLHYSAFLSNKQFVGYFSLVLDDPLIWEEDEKGDAIYIHRMCINPRIKGHNFSKHVLSWAYGYAAALERKYIRMDTWGENQTLVDYYTYCGFIYLKSKILGSMQDLPEHYSNIKLAMFQNNV